MRGQRAGIVADQCDRDGAALVSVAEQRRGHCQRDRPSYTNLLVNLGDAGNYVCVVTNACGAVTSAVATVTVSAAPAIVGELIQAARACVWAARWCCR